MRKLILLPFLAIISFAQGQNETGKISAENFTRLQQFEDTLQWLGDSMVQSADWDMREQTCIKFLKMLVQAMKTGNSFYYPFDSLSTISIINEPQDKFRIVTWQLTMKDGSYHYYGTIQMNEPDLKMYPLIDMSMFIGNEMDTILSRNSWYGCIYYEISVKKYKKNTYYMLYGWDGNDAFSNKKICDVLTFNEMGDPVFGAPIFEFDDKSVKTRVIIEYKEDAAAVMTYDAKEKKIVISYMRPENPMSEGIYFTYIPDGTYVGFRFKKGRWHYEEVVFNRSISRPPDYTPVHQGEDPWMYEKSE